MHTKDEDCTIDPATDSCRDCGVYHGDPCERCGGKGFHVGRCPNICGATNAEECSMIREREAAGRSDSIEPCLVHDNPNLPVDHRCDDDEA